MARLLGAGLARLPAALVVAGVATNWVLDISPFTHAPRLPGGTLSVPPLLWLSLLAVALVAVGLAGLRHRDIS